VIPISLNLRNFMSYTHVPEPLRFDGIHVAVLTGDNGHGKSALLDAITWALWGRARGRSVDELIHTGASEMEVEFEFGLQDQQYRVIRKRQRRGKSGYSDLQLAVLGDGVYRPLTERSLVETERLIERTLRMSYETFTSSSYVQQGRADSFTTSSPAERKRILAEILELGYYDELEGRAKERFKTREAQLADERRLAEDWEREIARRPEYQSEVDRLRVALAAFDKQVTELEEQTTLARSRVTQLEAAQQQVEEIGARLQRLSQEQVRIGSTLEERRSLHAQAQAVIARAAEVEQRAAELDAVRGELETANEQQQTFLPLERAREAAVRTLAAEQARLEGEVSQREQRLAELRKAAGQLSSVQADVQAAQREVARLAKTQSEHQQLQAQIGRNREEAAEKRATNTHLKGEMLDLRRRLDELEGLATCPTCQQPMNPRHRRKLLTEFSHQGSLLRDRFRAHEAACRELDATVSAAEQHLQQMRTELAGAEAAVRRLTHAEGLVRQAEEARQQLSTLQRELVERQRVLAEQRFAPAARQQLDSLQQRITTLGYDEARHAELRVRARALAAADRERELLEQARLASEHLVSQIAELDASLVRIADECRAEQTRHAQLTAITQALPAERHRLSELEPALQAAKRQRDESRDQCNYAQSKLDNCAFLERKHAESLVRQDALRREHSIYSDLAYAFGRRGVQAMIIETAIPEIEDEANRILSRMTDGRMHVKFETQRDVRSGMGTIETLDIKISDELGTRNYEMFSGGEGFRVNFAIRIALSRLLAHRAGTRLQTLVVDEGFGSQDQEGRDRIVEAIQAIEPEFEKILIITHLEDLRDRFPVRIEVSKTAQGSTYALR
jgi:DNA repair protein SbcC/Rad50